METMDKVDKNKRIVIFFKNRANVLVYQYVNNKITGVSIPCIGLLPILEDLRM